MVLQAMDWLEADKEELQLHHIDARVKRRTSEAAERERIASLPPPAVSAP